MKNKLKGFLLLEASVGLIIACLGVSLLTFTLGEGKKVQRNMEKKVDEKMAHYIIRKTGETEVKIHDKIYR